MRVAVATAVSLSLVGLALATDVEAAIRKPTSIPAQPLARALQALASDRQLVMAYRSEIVGDRQTSGAAGELTRDEALTQLLSGTGLTYRYLDDKTVTIVPVATSPATPGSETHDVRDSAHPPRTEERAPKKSFWDRFRLAQVGVNAAETTAPGSDSSDRKPVAQLDEIVVTAQKRLERLIDVPVPVTAITGESLVNGNQLRVQDYYTKVPGLGLALTGDGGAPTVTIRGVTTGGFTNPTVGVVVDDVPYGASTTQGAGYLVPDIDPSDLARVEVLRGPQGTLYGASSIGGLLKFVTIQPSMDAVSGRVQVGTSSVAEGNELGYNVRGSVNIPLTDALAVRASGFTGREPGYVDNVLTGERDINRRDTDGGRLAMLWRISDTFSLRLNALIQDSERFGTDDINTGLGADELRQSSLRDTGVYERKTHAYGATLNGTLGRFDLTSATGYNEDTSRSRTDVTSLFGGLASSLFNVSGAAGPFQNKTSKFSQELRVSTPLGERLTWLLGAFYTKEDVSSVAEYSAVNAVSGAVGGNLLTLDTPSTYKERAVFTNFTVDITDRVDVQIGGRASHNEQSFSTVRTGALSALFFGGDPSFVPGVSASDDAFTYLVTPRFKMSPDVMLYARLASGFRPGGPNSTCGPGVPCEFGADETRNYELGIKGQVFDRALSFEASVYRIDWDDIQLGVTAPSGIGYTDNGGKAKSQGAELSIEMRPLTGMLLSAWVAYNDAELTEVPLLSSLVAAAGDRLPYSSRRSGNLSLDQEFPLGARLTGTIGGSVSYIDDRKGIFQRTGAGTARQTFPAYAQVDFRAGARWDTWSLNAFVNNLTDRRGVLRGGLDAVISNPASFTYIQPRTVGLNLAKDF